jgi:hypothetical protein
MPYPKTNQKKTGVTREVSPNREKRSGRDDGTGGGQKKSGVTQEVSGPKGQKQSGDDNFKTTGGPGVTFSNSPNPGGHHQEGRIDEIEDI